MSRKRWTIKQRERVGDLIKSILAWAAVTALAFVYWMAMLLLASVFLMNIWKTSFEQLLHYGIILMGITSAVYAGILVYRKFH